nr:TPM domain-containing protein [Mycobacterium asiaticum]
MTLATTLLLAIPVAAQPPDKLTDHITDSNHVLTDSGRAAVSSAIDRLYRDRHIQLWVAYVDNFSRFKPENWAVRTRDASGMGYHDALLAVATNTKNPDAYTFTLPKGLSADELNSLQRNQIEPAVKAKDWTAAALATADALNKSASAPSRNWLPIVIAVVVVVLLLVLVLLFVRARRRRRAHAPGPLDVSIGGGDLPLDQALARADARLDQITDYVTRHRKNVGAEAQKQFAQAKQQLTAAHDKQATNPSDAIGHANAASTLAAKAQTLANADVLKAHRGK